MPIWAQLAYLLAAACFVLALKGLAAPRTARLGNLVGAAGAVLAVAVTFGWAHVHHVGVILVAIAAGSVLGVPAARRVPMTSMPQLVALFNGVGGAAAACVAVVEFRDVGGAGWASTAATSFTVLVGAVSFSGSLVTFLKLQELMTTRPVVVPQGRVVSLAVAAVALVLAVLLVPWDRGLVLGLLIVFSLTLGVLFVLPVGGADVPIVISLLNAFTGLTVAASGYLLDNVLLVVAGTLVGASGTLLTRLMAKAMGRPLTSTLFGAFTAREATAVASGEDRPVRSASADDVAVLLGYARKVVVVPGYGLAVAQAQHVVRELADLLTERGTEVSYAIHPVAGRMPGHMNVLLAEANVPYEELREMDSANAELPRADVALVIGANDVVNPAARTSPGSPIYGMPILNVDQADHVVFCKRSMRPGFAGIENELLYDSRTTLLFGDAKASLTALVTAVKSL